ncbi:MAG TPA: glycosyltransferase family 2 protein [Patescibacteria group bacterium]|nr:glycosyltransferase family 2 protein [Patescibacteria group bacterium]
MQTSPKVAIIYLSFHCEPYMPDVISALRRLTYPRDCVEFVIVDNPHPEHGSSVAYINQTVMPRSGREIPHVTLLAQEKNLGFSGGNNEGIKWALSHGYDYVYFHNSDAYMEPNCLEPLVDAMEHDSTIGVAQSLLLLHPETDIVNSTGNLYHYLGFGYCGDYRANIKILQLPSIKDISYASGAAVMMRCDLLRDFGLWDDDFFMYHEDLEYSFRIKVAGYRVVMIRDSVMYHKYAFSRSIQKYYWMERNRFAVLLVFFQYKTLLLLAPMLCVLEIGLFLFAVRGGWWREKLRVYVYWLHPTNWKLWLSKRRSMKMISKLRDRDLLANAVTGIFFQETAMESPILKYIGNPVMKWYYKMIIHPLVRW